MYTFPSELSRERLEAIMVKTVAILTKFPRKKLSGCTAPAWKNSPDQIELHEKLGIAYGQSFGLLYWTSLFESHYWGFRDHSYMHDDFQAYYVSTGKEEMVTTDYKKLPNTLHVANETYWDIESPWDSSELDVGWLAAISRGCCETKCCKHGLTCLSAWICRTLLCWMNVWRGDLSGVRGSMIALCFLCPFILSLQDEHLLRSSMGSQSFQR